MFLVAVLFIALQSNSGGNTPSLDSLIARANTGNQSAQLSLADVRIHDDNPGNDSLALNALERLVESGNTADIRATANGLLGLAYFNGIGGGLPDYDRSFAYLNAANIHTNMDARFFHALALFHQTGTAGADGGVQQAFDFFEQAALNGDARAGWHVGMYHLEGRVGPVDEVEALNWFRYAADFGDVQGMISTAVMFALGQGTEIDLQQSRYFYSMAADTGSVHAIRALGSMDYFGDGSPVNQLQGVALLRLAQSQGDVIAEDILSNLDLADDAGFDAAVESAQTAWLEERGLTRADLYGAQR